MHFLSIPDHWAVGSKAITAMFLFGVIGLFGVASTAFVMRVAPEATVGSVFYGTLFTLVLGAFGVVVSIVIYKFTKPN